MIKNHLFYDVSAEKKYQEVLNSLGSALKHARNKKGLTQKDVAYACEMEEQNYQRIERGRTNPTLRSLIRISVVLEVELSDLFKHHSK